MHVCGSRSQLSSPGPFFFSKQPWTSADGKMPPLAFFPATGAVLHIRNSHFLMGIVGLDSG